MHESLNTDNTPIGWIKMFGPDLVFQKVAVNNPIG
jgi:hypothetical protein